MSRLFDTPSTPPLRAVLEALTAGDLLVPRFQRPFGWDDEARLNLLDSVARGIPIGSLLVWRTNLTADDRGRLLEVYDHLGDRRLPAPPDSGPWSYVIDGHQRLTTLYDALHEPDTLGSNREPLRRTVIDLEVPETTRYFVLESSRLRPGPTRIPTTVLGSARAVFDAQRRLFEAGRSLLADRLEDLYHRFKDYAVPVIPLSTDDLDVAIHAFARINSTGQPMSEVDLVVALAYGRTRLRDRLADVASRFAERGWPIVDEAALLDLQKIRFRMDPYRADQQALLGNMGVYEPNADSHVDALLAESSAALDAAIRALKSVHVRGAGALPYRYQLLVLADALREAGCIDRTQDHAIREPVERWFWLTTFTELFTGATGRTITDARDELVAVLRGERSDFALAGAVIRPVARRQRWGAVRTLGRMLARLDALGPTSGRTEAAFLLGRLGNAAVHPLTPGMDRARPGSWVITTPEDLLQLRRWLDDPSERRPVAAEQLSHEEAELHRQGRVSTLQWSLDRAHYSAELSLLHRVGLRLEDSGASYGL
jgi:hypothetical protein